MLPYTESFGVFVPDTTFGIGAIDKLGQKVKAIGSKKVLVLTDEGVVKSGLLAPVEKALKAEQIDYSLFSGCLPDTPYSVVNKCVKMIRENNYDLLIAVGGGSVLDTVKVASVAVTADGTVADLVGAEKVKRPGLPKILVPTTAGTAAEWTWGANVTDDLKEGEHAKKGVWSTLLRPNAVIVDMQFTMNLPQKVTAITGIDTLAHGVEPFTSWRSNPVSDMFSSTCIRLVAQNLRSAYGAGNFNIAARYNMAIAASLGFSSAVSGGGIAHGMAYPLQFATDLSHGEAIAMILPHVMDFNMVADVPKFAQVAGLMGVDPAGLSVQEQALKGIQAVRDLIADVGLTMRMRDYGVKKEAIPEIVNTVFTNSLNLINLNCRKINKPEMTGIFEAAW